MRDGQEVFAHRNSLQSANAHSEHEDPREARMEGRGQGGRDDVVCHFF